MEEGIIIIVALIFVVIMVFMIIHKMPDKNVPEQKRDEEKTTDELILDLLLEKRTQTKIMDSTNSIAKFFMWLTIISLVIYGIAAFMN